MFSLKSELFKKQREVTARQSGVPAADTIRKHHKLKTQGNAAEETVPEHEKNPGVEERNARDLTKTAEEEDKSKLVKPVLEAKAKLYEKMTSGDILPDDESSAVFLVDFETKSIDARMKKEPKDLDKKPKTGVNVAEELSSEIEKVSNKDDDWVEYTDGLGRTRKCLRKDLSENQRIDKSLGIGTSTEKKNDGTKTLLSNDMRREMEREKWEQEALEELNGPIHYENLRAGEVRELGVGYFAFSTDQQTRELQMKMIKKMREDTERERKNVKERERKKRTALQARLEKVRLRRIKKLKSEGKEIPAKLLEPVELPPIEDDKEKEKPESNDDSAIVEVSKRDDTDRPVREWDKDKEWTPAGPPKPPKSWQDPRDERPDEFAPPSFYFNNNKSQKSKPIVDDEDSEPSTSGLIRESHSDLISRIRRELTEVAKNPGAVADVEQKTDSIAAPFDEIREEKSDLEPPPPGTSEESPNPNFYVPSADKPIAIKVKSMPKKTTVLLTKSAFDEDS